MEFCCIHSSATKVQKNLQKKRSKNSKNMFQYFKLSSHTAVEEKITLLQLQVEHSISGTGRVPS
jgi:ABC-type polar amino acid transport system ATPase subunit